MKVTNIVVFLSILILFQVNLVNAQPQNLKVGNKIPDQLLEVLKQGSEKSSKLTIINFWATWCVPCIRELKLLNSFIKERNDINIFSVTYEDPQKVEAFLQRNNELKDGDLTIISSDTLFRSFFPHQTLPHNIWINTEGEISYITGSAEMNIQNLQSFIKGEQIKAKEKKDIIDFDVFKPFHLSDSEFISRSILTKRIDGILSGQTIQGIGFGDKRIVDRVFCYNSNIRNILWVAVNRGVSPSDFYNTMRIETKDSLRFFSPSQAPKSFAKSKYSSVPEWRLENTFCYELSLPKSISDTLFYSYMLDDLKRNFNLKIEFVEDSILCSIITAENRKIASPNPNDSTFISINEKELVAQNISILSLFQFLNETVKDKANDIPLDPPFVDYTGGMRIDVHVEFKGRIPKYEYIKEQIKEKYGIKISHQRDSYKIAVIKDMG